MTTRSLQQDAAELLAAELRLSIVASKGHLTRADVEVFTRALEIARRLHLERADPNAPQDCERCDYIEREYGAEAIG